MEYKTIDITPEIAREWLDSMPAYQRKPAKGTVAEYAKDMAAGRWVEGTGDAFRFNKLGQMIDGQHRCLAVIESGVTIKGVVIEGLDDEVFLVLDRGRKRAASDTVTAPNSQVRAAMAKSLVLLNEGAPVKSVLAHAPSGSGGRAVSATEAAEVANSNEALLGDLVRMHQKMRAAHGGSFPTAVMTLLAAYAQENHGTLDVLSGYCDELVKPVQDRVMVCTMARERANNYRTVRGKSKNLPLLAIHVLAYKAFFEGKEPKVIQISSITKDPDALKLKRDWNLTR